MDLPSCFYQKAFWIILGIFVTILTSTTGLIYGQLIEDVKQIESRSIENQRELDRRFDSIFEDIPKIQKDIEIIKKQNQENSLLLCQALEICNLTPKP